MWSLKLQLERSKAEKNVPALKNIKNDTYTKRVTTKCCHVDGEDVLNRPKHSEKNFSARQLPL